MKHLLIDFENIQPSNLDNIPTEDTHIWLFLGANQKHLSIELVESLLRFGKRTHLVRLQKSGKNALDFYLSYYLGQITATDSQAIIGILSRDGGYDVLVEHIAENQHAQNIIRLATLDEIQTPTQTLNEENLAALPEKQPESSSTAHKSILPFFQAALTALRAPDAFRPSRLHNLQLNLRNYILRDLIADQDEAERDNTIKNVINKLKQQGFIEIDERREILVYHLSNDDFLARIQVYILNKRPNTFADFQAAVRERADNLCLQVNDSDVQAFARHLREQGYIRQNNGKIEYAPFPEPKPQPQIQPLKKSNTYQPDNEIWEKVVAAISVTKTKRPKKIQSLKNVIKAHAKCADKEIEQLLQYLQDKKYIQINNNQLIYLK